MTTTDLSAIVCRLIQGDQHCAEAAAAALLQQQYLAEGAHPDDSIFLCGDLRELATAAAIDAKARQTLAAYRIAQALLAASKAKGSPVLALLQEHISGDISGLLDCFSEAQEVTA